MVEGDLGEVVDREPAGGGGALVEHRGVDERQVGDGHDPAPRVTVRVAVGVELLEVDTADPGLLGELALGGLLGQLVIVHEAARERPAPLLRRLLAADEEDVQPPAEGGEDHRVGGERGGRVVAR